MNEFAFENGQLFNQEFHETNNLFQEVFSRYVRKDLLSKKNSVSRLFSIYIKKNEAKFETLKKEILGLLNKEGDFVPDFPNFDHFIKVFDLFLINMDALAGLV